MYVKCTVGSNDYSQYLKGLTISPGGPGAVGTATAYFDKQAAGLDILNRAPVHIWLPYNESTGAGIATNGRLFGGVVAVRDLGNVGTTAQYSVPLQDWNLLGKGLVRSAGASHDIYLTANTLANQLTQIVFAVQVNNAGAGAVNTGITVDCDVSQDMSAEVLPTGFTDPMLERGHNLGWYIRNRLAAAMVLNPALRLTYWFSPKITYGPEPTGTFGGPVLYVRDLAVESTPDFKFSDTPGVGEYPIFNVFQRRLDSAEMVQKLWGLYKGAAFEYVESASSTTYPNIYQAYQFSTSGAWGTEAIDLVPLVGELENPFSVASRAVIYGYLERYVKARAYPRETIEFETNQPVRPGHNIWVTYSLWGLSNAYKRVVGVNLSFEGTELWARVVCGQRRLGLLDVDDETMVAGAPEEGDKVGPIAPASFDDGTHVWREDRQQWNVPLTWVKSGSADVEYQWLKLGTGRLIQIGKEDSAYNDLFLGPSQTLTDSYVFATDVKKNEGDKSNRITISTAAVPAMLPPTALTVVGLSGGVAGTYSGRRNITEVDITYTASAYAVSGYEARWEENGVSKKQWLGMVLAATLFITSGSLVTNLKVWAYGYDSTRAAATTSAATFTAKPAPEPSSGDLYNGSAEIPDAQNASIADGWTHNVSGSGNSVVRSSAAPFRGANHWRLVRGGVTGSYNIRPTLRLSGVPGDRYRVHFWAANPGGSAGSLTVQVQSNAGFRTNIGATYLDLNATVAVPVGDYVAYSVEVVSLTRRYFDLSFENALANTTVDLDDIQLEHIPADATPTKWGLMSAADKTKLNALPLQTGGSNWPASPAVGDRHYNTTLRRQATYLTAPNGVSAWWSDEYDLVWTSRGANMPLNNASTNNYVADLVQRYDVWITFIRTAIYKEQTSTTSIYWALQVWNPAATSVYEQNTPGSAVNFVWVAAESVAQPSSWVFAKSATPAAVVFISVSGNPGNAYCTWITRGRDKLS